MTLQQLEQRLSDLEKKVAEIQHQVRPLHPCSTVQDTFGIFANDPEFDEIVKLGQEYRQQANLED